MYVGTHALCMLVHMHCCLWLIVFAQNVKCEEVPAKLIVFTDESHANRKNGYPAITDANLVLGRILPEFFPSIFGEDEKQPLDSEASKQALQKIAHEVNEQAKSTGQPEKSVEEVCRLSCSHCSMKSSTCNMQFSQIALLAPLTVKSPTD